MAVSAIAREIEPEHPVAISDPLAAAGGLSSDVVVVLAAGADGELLHAAALREALVDVVVRIQHNIDPTTVAHPPQWSSSRLGVCATRVLPGRSQRVMPHRKGARF